MALSAYFDYASYTQQVLDSSGRSRALHGYGALVRAYLPSSLHARFQPYLGGGLGSYRLSDNYADSSFRQYLYNDRTRLGYKVFAGLETSYHFFVEATYAKPGLETLDNSQLSLGIRL